MNHSGDAAEQIVRMSLDGVEVAAKITGTAAKEVALMLLAALKSPEKSAVGGLKLKGRERLNTMLKSGKALEIFSVKERDLRTFTREAKRYGIVYCVLRNSKNTPDGLCDIMVKADDAPKINRLVERFRFAAVDVTGIESEIARDMAAGRSAEISAESLVEPARTDAVPERQEVPEAPEINDVDQLLDELLGTGEGKAVPEAEKTDADKSGADMTKTDMTGTDKTEAGQSTPDTSEISDMPDMSNASGTPGPAKTAPEKAKPAPKRAGRGAKRDAQAKEPAPATDARTAPDPLAENGGRNSPAHSPAHSPTADHPFRLPPPKTNPSEPSSDSRKNSEKPFSSEPKPFSSKPSVRQELREITATQKAKVADAPKREEPIPEKPKFPPPTIAHKQPTHGGKSKKSKGR
jgi:hypothetical protein